MLHVSVTPECGDRAEVSPTFPCQWPQSQSCLGMAGGRVSVRVLSCCSDSVGEQGGRRRTAEEPCFSCFPGQSAGRSRHARSGFRSGTVKPAEENFLELYHSLIVTVVYSVHVCVGVCTCVSECACVCVYVCVAGTVRALMASCSALHHS